MQKLKIITAGSGGIWFFSSVMIWIFPRVRYPAISTVFAVLFWLSLIVTVFFAYLLINRIRKRQRKKQIPSSAYPLTGPENTGHIVPDTYMPKQNPPEVRK